MKKFALLLLMAIAGLYAVAQSVQKPIIMVIPSKQWCAENNYGTRLSNGEFAPNLNMALEDATLRDAINAIENVFSDKDYPPKNLSASLDVLAEQKAMAMVQTGKDDSGVIEDDIDVLLRSIAPDVAIEVEVKRLSQGAFNQVGYKIQVKDAASSKSWMSRSDVSARTPAPVERLMQDAVYSFADEMINKIQAQFDIMKNEGREISIYLKISDSCPYNFESEIDHQGETWELGELIEDWISQNAVNGAYSLGQSTRNSLTFEQCRIPLLSTPAPGSKKKAKGLTAKDFANNLGRYLKSVLGDVSVSTVNKGLGKAHCVISGS